jgi:hypothetical protein
MAKEKSIKMQCWISKKANDALDNIPSRFRGKILSIIILRAEERGWLDEEKQKETLGELKSSRYTLGDLSALILETFDIPDELRGQLTKYRAEEFTGDNPGQQRKPSFTPTEVLKEEEEEEDDGEGEEVKEKEAQAGYKKSLQERLEEDIYL